ncbi:unnamed protein product [Ectocarpus sp. CCAP 1310/34]|nr:unnamed protein product [Ectocarpus sp. CCAP 1310/34]
MGVNGAFVRCSIDRANRLTNEKTSVLVRWETQNVSIVHYLGPRDRAS